MDLDAGVLGFMGAQAPLTVARLPKAGGAQVSTDMTGVQTLLKTETSDVVSFDKLAFKGAQARPARRKAVCAAEGAG